MTLSGTIGIEKSGIGRVLADGSLIVPQYQRSYAWEDRNVTDFLDDIERAVKADATEYFLGSIVLAVADDVEAKPEVVDGQQRLATTAILIAEIRNYFQSQGDSRHQDVDGQYLMNRDLRSQDDVQKLQMNERDNDFFLKSILRPTVPLPLPQRDSHRMILGAKRLCEARVKSLVASAKAAGILVDVVLFLKERAKVIVLTVPSDENAFVLFETLNDRGLDLALSDLLKNYLFRVSGNRLAEVRSSWIAMYGLFEATNTEPLVVDFIRQTYSSRNGLTREKDLFATLKKQITGKQNAVEFAEDLRRHAVLYQALLSSDHAHWRSFSSAAGQHVATLNFLGLTRIRPLLLAVLDEFSQRDTELVLKRAVSWGVRLTIQGGLGSGTLEEVFSQRAKEIRDGAIKGVEALNKAMEAFVPNDTVFREAFKVAVVTKSKLARYLLRSLEREVRNEREPELVVNGDPSELNLEHVLPQSPDQNWPALTLEVASAFAHRLGNLVLLRKSENETLGNGSFAQKKSVLQASSLILTKQVGNESSWGPDEIAKRQEELAKLAVKVWAMT